MPDTKNPGPLLVSYGYGDINALPTEWRARMGFRQEDQQVPLGYVLEQVDPPPPEPIPVIGENRLIQTRTDERKRTSVILNPPPSNGGVVPPGGGPPDSWVLVSEERVPWGQVATRTRAFVPEGSHLVLTDDMLQAEQKNLGIGLDQVVLTAPLPGPQIVDTKWDEIASLVSTVKRRKLVSQIVDGETIVGGVWQQTSREGETATVASEIVVTRTLPSSTLTSTEFDQESVLVTTKQTKKVAATIVDGETIVGGVWKKIFHKGETGLVATEIEQSRVLPGPALASTRIDEDSTLINITKTKKETGLVVSGETIVGGVWKRVTKEGQTQLIALETVENRTLPGTTIESTKFDQESVKVTTRKTRKDKNTIVDGETIVGGLWKKIYHEGESGLVATEIEESRTLPGPTVISWRIEDNGTLVTIAKTKKLTSTIVEGETATTSLWTKTYGEGETTLISTEIVETRALPTPAVPTSRFDDDSTVVNITRQRMLASAIVTQEIVTPTLWTKRYKEAESGLIATQVEEVRALPGAAIISTHYDNDNTLVTVTKTKKRSDQFTDSESYNVSTHVWTRKYREGVTGNIATEVIESRTLPGRPITSFRIDEDGATVTIVKTKKLTDDIASGEFADAVLWTKITAEGETELFATEVKETRALGGPAVTSYRIDEDGATVTFVKRKKLLTQIVEDETVTALLWTKTYAEQVTSKVANEVVETRPLGTNAPIVESSRIDRDGLIVNVVKIKKQATAVTPSETATSTLWTRKFAEQVTGLVATEVTETATLPGPNVVSTRLEDDGRFTTIAKQRKLFSDVATDESMNGVVWTKVYKEGESGKLATQVTETRSVQPIAANVVPGSRIDQDLVEVTTTRAIKTHANINPGVTLAGGVITKIEKKEVSDLVGEEIKSTQPVFDPIKYGISIENPLPSQFRSLGKISEEVHVVAGQAVVQTLAGTQLEKSQEQINALQKRTVVKSIDTANLPVAYAGKEILLDFGGVLTITEKKIDVAGSASIDVAVADVTNINIVREKLERFGGFGVREKATVTGGFPILVGGDVDVEFGVVLPFTQQVVAAGTIARYAAGAATEIKPIDAARSLKIVRTTPTSGPNPITDFKMAFPGTTDVSFPPQLLSITAIDAGTGGGAGSYSEGGSYTIVNNGSGQLSLRGESNSSAHSMMDVIPLVKQVWGQNIACTHWLFFMLGPVINYSAVLTKLRSAAFMNDPNLAAWPKFSPQSCNITCVGATVRSTAKAVKSFSDTITSDFLGRPTRGGSGRSQGGGTSQEVDLNVRTVTIPPTIHAQVTIGNAGRTSALYNAYASINLGGVMTAAVNSQAGSHVYPTTFAATPGTATIPTSGNFIHKMRIEPWKFGYFKIDCEVVNASSW